MNKGYGGGGGPRAVDAYEPSAQDIQIIMTGDLAVSAERTVQCSDRFGRALKERGLKASQIRNIFGAVRRIEMNWRDDTSAEEQKAAYRELLLLQPKLGYQSERVKAVKPLANVLTAAIQQVQGDRDRFQRFVDFFEAILAYHKAAGGAD